MSAATAAEWRAVESFLFAEMSAAAADADRRARLDQMYRCAKVERVIAEVRETIETTATTVAEEAA